MSMEVYDKLTGEQILHEEVMKGIDDYENGKVVLFEEVFKNIQSNL